MPYNIITEYVMLCHTNLANKIWSIVFLYFLVNLDRLNFLKKDRYLSSWWVSGYFLSFLKFRDSFRTCNPILKTFELSLPWTRLKRNVSRGLSWLQHSRTYAFYIRCHSCFLHSCHISWPKKRQLLYFYNDTLILLNKSSFGRRKCFIFNVKLTKL